MPAADPARRDRFLEGLRGGGRLMGILNVTPDSFSDGGRFNDPEAALIQARRMAGEGADILDVGGESTRPGFEPVPEAEEAARVLPVLEALARHLPEMPVSIDTTKPGVARAAIGAGAVVVNDVWGFQGDPGMADAVAGTGAAAVLMHNRDRADPALDILAELEAFFARSLRIADDAGVPKERLVLDPGIGFGKTPLQNLIVLKRLRRLKQLFDLPLLVGLSRKSTIGRVLDGRPAEGRLFGTIGADLYAHHAGASALRVHDVGVHRDALRLWRAIEAADG
ncbi:MAG: dihydropteroate synthase [Geminicoccaceae bacterium]|nr:dihydropteroate synthase [Geminicoccaceae bacterium]